MRVGAVAAACALSVCLGGAVRGEAASPGAEASFFDRWIRTRLTIGADWTHLSLDDTRRLGADGPDNKNTRGNYLGSLWGLDARQHVFPDPFVEYRVVSSVGVGASFDQRRARTLDWGDNVQRVAVFGDGDVEVRGVQAYAFGRYRIRMRVTPYGRIGIARYRSRFLVLPSWTGGDPGRVIQVDDTSGWFFAVGSEVAVGHHAALDAFYRRSLVRDVATRDYNDIIHRPQQHRSGAFPMHGHELGVGVAYTF